MPEVIRVIAQKALLLDEIDEHEAVEHDRGIPLEYLLVRNTLDEFEERIMLFLETVVESLGHFFGIKARVGTPVTSKRVRASSCSKAKAIDLSFWISDSPDWPQ